MAYGTAMADRVRRHLATRSDVIEKRIVGGGLGFMVRGHLCCGVSDRGLTVRVGPEAKAELVTREHVRPLTLGAQETTASVVLESAGLTEDASLLGSVDWAPRSWTPFAERCRAWRDRQPTARKRSTVAPI